MTTEEPSLDAHKTVGTSARLRAIYETLVVYDESGNPQPYLAESIESADAQTWSIRLPSGVRFHDGTPLDARAVVTNLQRHMDPSARSLAFNFGQNLATVEARDSATVEVVTKAPWASFPEALTQMSFGAIVSPKSLTEGSLATKPVGTGPYRFVEHRTGVSLMVERNPEYRLPVTSSAPRIEFRVLTDPTSMLASAERGELDVVQLPGRFVPMAESRGLGVSRGGISELLAVINNEVVGDVRVRRAMSLATEKEALNQVLYGGEFEVARIWGDPHSSWYVLDRLELPGYDPVAARALVAEAERDIGPIRFELQCGVENNPLGELLQKMWQEVGIDVDLATPDSGTLTGNVYSGRYQVACISSSYWLDPGLKLLRAYTTGSDVNPSKYANPELDALLVAAQQSSDENARRTAYMRAQEILLTDLPTLPLVHVPYAAAAAEGVSGLAVLRDGSFLVDRVTFAAGA